MNKDTLIVKTGVLTEITGKGTRHTTWAQTWDGSLYFEVGESLPTYDSNIARARAALDGEHVDNGSWVKGSLG